MLRLGAALSGQLLSAGRLRTGHGLRRSALLGAARVTHIHSTALWARGLAVDSAGNLFVANEGSGEIFVFDASDQLIGKFSEIPGHGPLSTLGEERRNNPFLQDEMPVW